MIHEMFYETNLFLFLMAAKRIISNKNSEAIPINTSIGPNYNFQKKQMISLFRHQRK